MADQEPFPSNRDHGVETQTPHSGVHYDEKPVRVFDKTKLDEAYEQGLIETPDSPAPLVEEEKGAKAKRNKLGHFGIAGLAAGVAATGIFGAVKVFGGNDKGPAERTDRQEANTSQSANQTEEQAPTPSNNVEPSQEVEPNADIQPISVEKFPTLEQQIARGFEIVTAAVNDPGPNISGPTYKYDEALFGADHYDTDMKDSHDWLGELSRNIGYMNDDFSILKADQPKFTDEFKFMNVVEQKSDDTAIVELLETTNAPDLDKEYKDRIPDYLGSDFNLTGEETTYWEVSMRYEDGQALFKEIITLPDYQPASN